MINISFPYNNIKQNIKVCFTVKGRKYAYALINTVINAKFNACTDFEIFCCDVESFEILSSYGLSSSLHMLDNCIDVYNAKILNAIELSSKTGYTIVMLDAVMNFDYLSLNGTLGRLKIKDNTMYCWTYKESNFDDETRFKNLYTANMIIMKNMSSKMIDRYLKCMNHTKPMMHYEVEESRLRYMRETSITEESIINQHKWALHVKKLKGVNLARVLKVVHPCWGGYTLNRLLESTETTEYVRYNDYVMRTEILNKIRNKSYVNLPDTPNAYKVGERTQVLYCFTVSHKNYALALVNTIINANFESINNFHVLCCDDESYSIMKEYGIPADIETGTDVYNMKVLHAMSQSIEHPNTLIVALDVIVDFDFHMSRGYLSRLHDMMKFEDNTIYLMDYYDVYGSVDVDSKKYIANGMIFWNIDNYLLEEYQLRMINTDNVMHYINEDSKRRYAQEARVTEESVLNANAALLHVKHMPDIMVKRLLLGVRFCLGGNTLTEMISTNKRHLNSYRVDDDEIWGKLCGR